MAWGARQTASRVFVISDLHLGGDAPYMMSCPERLAAFVDGLPAQAAPDEVIASEQSGDVGIEAAYKLKKTVYIIRSVPSADRFECLVFRDGDVVGEFQSRPRPSEDPRLDSVLGETTPRGILRALEVPPELLGLDGEE